LLPKKNRVPSFLIPQILKKGMSFYFPFFNIFIIPNSQRTRFAFIVPEKVVKKAVKRNRIKRLLRQAVKENRGGLQKIDIVLSVKKNLSEKTFSQIKEKVGFAFEKIKKKE